MRFVVLLLAVAACSVGESEPEASLELIVMARDSRLDDPADMAGFRVEITGAGPTKVYQAPHFKGPHMPPFRVPDTGQATVSTQIEQDDEIVVQGSLNWELLPGTRWTLFIERAPELRAYGFPDCDVGECEAPGATAIPGVAGDARVLGSQCARMPRVLNTTRSGWCSTG